MKNILLNSIKFRVILILVLLGCIVGNILIMEYAPNPNHTLGVIGIIICSIGLIGNVIVLRSQVRERFS